MTDKLEIREEKTKNGTEYIVSCPKPIDGDGVIDNYVPDSVCKKCEYCYLVMATYVKCAYNYRREGVVVDTI